MDSKDKPLPRFLDDAATAKFMAAARQSDTHPAADLGAGIGLGQLGPHLVDLAPVETETGRLQPEPGDLTPSDQTTAPTPCLGGRRLENRVLKEQQGIETARVCGVE
jgi:hypothetical protein